MIKVIKTSYSGKRLSLESVENKFEGVVNDVIVKSDIKYQTHLGFGGAVTDSTVYCCKKVDKQTQDKIVKAYYSKDGLNYNLLRLTVHSSDFSPESYVYTEGDDLSTFSLAHDDEGRIPFVKACMELNDNITFFASPWSPPAFAKSNGKMNAGGLLKDEYREFWAEYYARYLEELRKRGINVSFVNVQNEPEAIQTWESREVSAIEEGEEIRDYLVPAFRRHGLDDVKFFIWDHNRDRLVRRAIDTLSIPGVKEHVWGVGYHWYCCDKYENLTALHTLYPDLHIFLSECCVELAHDSTTGKKVEQGLWHNGQRYAEQIINDLNNYSEGYIDWNLVLDENGGPNHAGNFCEAPVMLDGKGGIEYNPSYWHIAHFSKYITPGARRVFQTGGASGVYQTAYVNPDGTKVVVVLNMRDHDVKTNFDVDGDIFGLTLEKDSIVTILL